MNIFDVSCPKCGGSITIDKDKVNFGDRLKCNFCGSNFIYDDGVERVEFHGGKEMGYEFERGRHEAMEDIAREKDEAERQREKNIEDLDRVMAQAAQGQGDAHGNFRGDANGLGRNGKSGVSKEDVKFKWFGKFILWILFFPLMFVYTVVRSKRLTFEAKLFIVIIFVGAIIYILTGGKLWS